MRAFTTATTLGLLGGCLEAKVNIYVGVDYAMSSHVLVNAHIGFSSTTDRSQTDSSEKKSTSKVELSDRVQISYSDGRTCRTCSGISGIDGEGSGHVKKTKSLLCKCS